MLAKLLQVERNAKQKTKFFAFALPRHSVISTKSTLLQVERNAKQKTKFFGLLPSSCPRRAVTQLVKFCPAGLAQHKMPGGAGCDMPPGRSSAEEHQSESPTLPSQRLCGDTDNPHGQRLTTLNRTFVCCSFSPYTLLRSLIWGFLIGERLRRSLPAEVVAYRSYNTNVPHF